MNTVFDTSLLFISDTDWQDEIKRDNFLSNLFQNLEYIKEYDICKIYWSNELEERFWHSPQLQPWRSYPNYKYQIIPTLYNKFKTIKSILDIPKELEESQVEPSMQHNYDNQEIDSEFMRLLHKIITQEEEIYLCLSKENQAESYEFSCQCHSYKLLPELIKEPDNWLKEVDINKFFPNNKYESDKLDKLIEWIAKLEFSKEPEDFKCDYDFTNRFLEDIIREKDGKHRKKLLYSMVRRLLLTQNEAARDSSLQDENIKGIRRFRVTKEKRIHYIYDKDGILFQNYYMEGEHDKGL